MYQFSIQESAPIGTAVGRVKAEDSDVGENTDMTYLLKEESGTGGHVFKVTTDSDTQEAIILLQKVPLPQEGWGKGWSQGALDSHLLPPHSTPLYSTPGIRSFQRPRTNLGKRWCFPSHFTKEKMRHSEVK